MVLPGHLAGGYIAASTVLSLLDPSLSHEQIATLLVIGTIAGELPDIDLIFFYFKHKKDRTETHQTSESENHRNYVTHIPLFWLIVGLVIMSGGYIFNSLYVTYTGLLLIAGTWSHLILDSIDYGIRWLAPWSQNRFALKKDLPRQTSTDRPGSLMQYIHFVLRTYWRMSTFWFEILVTLCGLGLLYFSL